MNLHIIEVVTGIALVYLLLSLLITAIQEYIASVLKLRAKVLEKTIQNMFQGDEGQSGEISEKFYHHPLIRSLSKNDQQKPSYLPSEMFAEVLGEILQKESGQNVSTFSGIQNLEKGRAKNLLLSLWAASNENEKNFKTRLEDWFNSVMDRISGSYKRLVQKYIFMAGLMVAILFNADSLMIYRTLSTDSAKRSILAGMASGYIEMYGKADRTKDKEDMLEKFKAIDRQLDSLSQVSSVMGLGWTPAETQKMFCPPDFLKGLGNWALKILGWLITSMAILLGAPFWFDLLSKIVNIRNSGKVPQKPRIRQ